MDFLTLFKDLGYPAAVTGVLLWIITTKLEKVHLDVEDLDKTITRNSDLLVDIKGKLDKLLDREK